MKRGNCVKGVAEHVPASRHNAGRPAQPPPQPACGRSSPALRPISVPPRWLHRAALRRPHQPAHVFVQALAWAHLSVNQPRKSSGERMVLPTPTFMQKGSTFHTPQKLWVAPHSQSHCQPMGFGDGVCTLARPCSRSQCPSQFQCSALCKIEANLVGEKVSSS